VIVATYGTLFLRPGAPERCALADGECKNAYIEISYSSSLNFSLNGSRCSSLHCVRCLINRILHLGTPICLVSKNRMKL
jgi:hypothetical protein